MNTHKLSPFYIILCGLPGSGKSYLRERIYEAFMGNVQVLSSDDLIEEYADAQGKTYNEVFVDTIENAKREVDALRRYALRNHFSIIHDQTNLTEKSRRRALSNIPHGYTTICLHVEVADDVRDQRLLTRDGKTIPHEVLEDMKRQYVRPATDEKIDFVGSGHDWVDVLRSAGAPVPPA